MKLELDRQSLEDLTQQLKSWTCTPEQLQVFLEQEHHYARLRGMEPHWYWGPKVKRLVFSLVACARRRNARVFVTDSRYTFHSAIIEIELPGKEIRIEVRHFEFITVCRTVGGVSKGRRDFHLDGQRQRAAGR